MNQYGQYDIFNTGMDSEEGRIVLWGYTNKEAIRNQFIDERPIENRFFERVLELTKNEYKEFIDDHHRYRLIPIPYSKNPLTKWGQALDDRLGRDKKFRPSEGIIDNYQYRISTQYEYDFISTNYAEIVGTMFTNLFRTYDFPLDISIFKKKVRNLLNGIHYEDMVLTFHPNAISYMNETPDAYERFKKNFPFDYLREFATSELILWYLTFEDMIGR